MFCSKCGTKVPDDAEFCGNCGARIKRKVAAPTPLTVAEPKEEEVQKPLKPVKLEANPLPKPEPEPKEKKRGNFLTGVLIIAILAALAGIGTMVYMNKDVFFGTESALLKGDEESGEKAKNSGKESGDAEDEELSDNEDDAPEGGDFEDVDFEEDASDSEEVVMLAESDFDPDILVLNRSNRNALEIDVFADNYQPGERNFNYKWDRSLFYTLEDVDPNSAADGQINGYVITRKMLKNAATGNKMEYEIYTSPATGKVNKIVSIEYKDSNLEITDYYYDDKGKISFIFVRDDVNYVPSYALPTKDGERYYFNGDCMVKWRVVSGGAMTNLVIGRPSLDENTMGAETMYSTLGNDQKSVYDAVERKMINAAYNTYNIVLNTQSVTEITGYVYSQDGAAFNGAAVTLYEGEKPIYQKKTDAEGYYGIVVPAENRSYHVTVSAEKMRTAKLYDIKIQDTLITEFQEPVYLAGQSEPEYEAELELQDALNYAADGNSLAKLNDAVVYIREGCNHRSGTVLVESRSDADGRVKMELKPGMYTAEIVKEGYDTAYYNFALRQNREKIQFNSSPTLAAGEVRIVLTWDAVPADLDSHLFTPYDSAFGDTTYHIWYGNKNDMVGNNLDVDDTDGYGPETMTIPVLKNGLYKYYVADFTNCSGNDPTSYQMSQSGATVHVYTSNGLTQVFHVPANRPGVIWEVFEIRNGAIVPIQRYYSNIDDKTWWHSDK